ncbi:MAG: hypothetical protein AAB536_00575 [Patescibacteria group bacterium]
MNEPKEEKLPNQAELSEGEKDVLDINFKTHALDADVGNSLMKVSMYADAGRFEDITPVQTYEEYLAEKASAASNPGAYYDYVISRSDPVLVQEYNARIRAFNEELENIKRERDGQKVRDFFKKMMEFLGTKKRN